MSRFVLCTILAVVFISCVHSQLAGGYNAVPADKYNELLETINGLTHTGEIAGGKLVKVKCATSQVVAGANYIVIGDWQVGAETKNCEIRYSKGLDGNVKVNEVKCGITGCGINPDVLSSLIG